MKKIVICLIAGLFLMANAGSAQNNYNTTFGADFHLNTIHFDHLFDNGEPQTISTWELAIKGKVEPTSDLVLLIDHALGNAPKTSNPTLAENASLSADYTQAVLLYQFFQDDPMSIYGGIGYHFVHNFFKNLVEQNGELINYVWLEGSGFIAASQVNFYVLDKVTVKALIQAAPWYNWSYRVKGYIKDTGGSKYGYLVTAEYDLNDRWVIRAEYGGTRTTVHEIEVSDGFTINRNTFTSGGLQIGVSYKF
ncbi:MAG: hypothetical protein GX228_10150 [Firmicutes bacterium]|jgi:opacity protein-like surface antigen|nr:outer membrane beta-barrel protein [Bacillota bacterium]NLL89255.1 hypothetical protein [Bacillota bacterium]